MLQENENVVLVSRKSDMSYVNAVSKQFTKHDTVVLKSRGIFNSKNLLVAHLCRDVFLKDLNLNISYNTIFTNKQVNGKDVMILELHIILKRSL